MCIRDRFWALIHLRKSGFTGRELFGLYAIFVRPVIEYCSSVYHSMLTVSQEETLERMQKQVIKLAFGWTDSYVNICNNNGIDTLKNRRLAALDRFVAKTADSDRFADAWFPVRDLQGPEIRNRRIFQETKSKTTRFYNSPLAFMRRRANDLLEGAE